MGLAGRFFSRRDMIFVNSVNAELMGDIIQTDVTIYKIAAGDIDINVYGESSPSTGINFYDGVEITAMIDRGEINTDYDSFGPDRKQVVAFKFRENMLKQINLFPEIGDMILFNDRYHEIDNVVQEQFLGGISDKSHSIIVNTHYTRLSKLNIVSRLI